MRIDRCPLCNGEMDFPSVFERATVCIDCYDSLAGNERGDSRRRWAQTELRDRARRLDRLAAVPGRRRRHRRWEDLI